MNLPSMVENSKEHQKERNLRRSLESGLCRSGMGPLQIRQNRSTSPVKMGNLGLGGLVRTTTKDIFNIVEEVRCLIPKVRVHLFGITRPNSLNHF